MAQAQKEIMSVARKPLSKVVQEWEEQNQRKISDETHIELIYKGIGELDAQTLNSFTNCVKLSLSSNFITKIIDIHLHHLETLSLGRNKIRYFFYLILFFITFQVEIISKANFERIGYRKNI